MKYRPAFRIGDGDGWRKFEEPAQVTLDENKKIEIYFEFTFDFDNEKNPVYFAYCFPYSYCTLQKDLNKYEEQAAELNSSVYFHREVLTQSTEGRNVDLLTISSNFGIKTKKEETRIEGLFPIEEEKRPQGFTHKKKIVFLTGRVHPGETPASYGIQGVIEFLLNDSNPEAKKLRDLFVFKIIPMINPDGVERGHFRMDGHGINLNRYYTNPCSEKQPTVFAIKQLLTYYGTQRIFFFCDFHAHGSPKNCFFYGNCLGFVMQVEARTFARMMSLTCPDFSYGNCNFSKKHMGRPDNIKGRDKRSKEGSARVSTYRACHLVHSYTLEFGYHQNVQGESEAEVGYYTQESFREVGRSLLRCLLELFRKKTCAPIAKSNFKSVEGIRKSIAENIRKKYKKKEGNLLHKSNNIHDIIEKMYYQTIKTHLELYEKEKRLKYKNRSDRKHRTEGRNSPKKRTDISNLKKKRSKTHLERKKQNMYKINSSHQKIEKNSSKFKKIDAKEYFEALKEPFKKSNQKKKPLVQVLKKTEFKIDNLILDSELDTRHWSYGIIKRNIRKNPIRPKPKASQQFQNQIKRLRELGSAKKERLRSPREGILYLAGKDISETKRLMRIRSINEIENNSQEIDFSLMQDTNIEVKGSSKRKFPELIKVQSSMIIEKAQQKRNSKKGSHHSKSINATINNKKVIGFIGDSQSEFTFKNLGGKKRGSKGKKRTSAKMRYSSLQVKNSKIIGKEDIKIDSNGFGNYNFEPAINQSRPNTYNALNFSMFDNGTFGSKNNTGYNMEKNKNTTSISNVIIPTKYGTQREKLLQDKTRKILEKKRKKNFREIQNKAQKVKQPKKSVKKRSKNRDRSKIKLKQMYGWEWMALVKRKMFKQLYFTNVGKET